MDGWKGRTDGRTNRVEELTKRTTRRLASRMTSVSDSFATVFSTGSLDVHNAFVETSGGGKLSTVQRFPYSEVISISLTSRRIEQGEPKNIHHAKASKYIIRHLVEQQVFVALAIGRARTRW